MSWKGIAYGKHFPDAVELKFAKVILVSMTFLTPLHEDEDPKPEDQLYQPKPQSLPLKKQTKYMAILSLKWCFEYPWSIGLKSPCLEEHMDFGDPKHAQDNPTLSLERKDGLPLISKGKQSPSPPPHIVLFSQPPLSPLQTNSGLRRRKAANACQMPHWLLDEYINSTGFLHGPDSSLYSLFIQTCHFKC